MTIPHHPSVFKPYVCLIATALGFCSTSIIKESTFGNFFPFVTFDKPIEKDFLVSNKGSLGLFGDFKRIGELLSASFEYFNQLISRATSGDLQQVIHALFHLGRIIANPQVLKHFHVEALQDDYCGSTATSEGFNSREFLLLGIVLRCRFRWILQDRNLHGRWFFLVVCLRRNERDGRIESGFTVTFGGGAAAARRLRLLGAHDGFVLLIKTC
mmetsp:Transcript_17197/g.32555  ORF Transcript_17197/g.32555 Transcript_17197/m.32555 type:complete len:213 (-) Transcript_17197:1338-1976(-)